MKLSEMPTRQAAACMAEIVTPAVNILNSDAVKAWYEANKEEKLNMITIMKLVPGLAQDEYDDVTTIISILSGKTKAELDEQPFGQTLHDLKGCIDQDLISFFT